LTTDLNPLSQLANNTKTLKPFLDLIGIVNTQLCITINKTSDSIAKLIFRITRRLFQELLNRETPGTGNTFDSTQGHGLNMEEDVGDVLRHFPTALLRT
jgi:hypothetical protein